MTILSRLGLRRWTTKFTIGNWDFQESSSGERRVILGEHLRGIGGVFGRNIAAENAWTNRESESVVRHIFDTLPKPPQGGSSTR